MKVSNSEANKAFNVLSKLAESFSFRCFNLIEFQYDFSVNIESLNNDDFGVECLFPKKGNYLKMLNEISKDINGEVNCFNFYISKEENYLDFYKRESLRKGKSVDSLLNENKCEIKLLLEFVSSLDNYVSKQLKLKNGVKKIEPKFKKTIKNVSHLDSQINQHKL